MAAGDGSAHQGWAVLMGGPATLYSLFNLPFPVTVVTGALTGSVFLWGVAASRTHDLRCQVEALTSELNAIRRRADEEIPRDFEQELAAVDRSLEVNWANYLEGYIDDEECDRERNRLAIMRGEILGERAHLERLGYTV